MSGDVYKQDIVSGINFKGKGLRTILDRVHEGMVSGVVLMRKDRLSRFATDLLERFFRKAGVKFVVHCANEDCRESRSVTSGIWDHNLENAPST